MTGHSNIGRSTSPLMQSDVGRIRVLTMNDGRMNCLHRPMRVALFDAIGAAEDDPQVQAIVLASEGAAWCAGADLNEMDTPECEADPDLHAALGGLIDSLSKPVIAAIGATALGGGLEIALACHYRLAASRAKVGLPEVTLGLIPGAGGTQRLPRAIGLEAAANVILTGRPVAAGDVAVSGLFDAIVETGLMEHALSFAAGVIGKAPPRLRDRSVAHHHPEAYLKAVRRNVEANPRRTPGHLAAVDCLLAAANLPFEEGMQLEYATFRSVRADLGSAPFRHVFFSERAAGRIGDLPTGTQARRISLVGIIGAGIMGQGIALSILEAGFEALLLDSDEEALKRGIAKIGDAIAAQVQRGKLTQDKADGHLGRLKPAQTYAALADCDLIIEAAAEDMAVKRAIFAAADQVMKKGAILATNTSTLDIDALATCTGRPSDVLGLHFFNPANVMRLLEVVRGAATAPDVLVTGLHIAKRLGKVAVVSGVCDGFIGNRMVERYLRQAQFLVEEGALPADVDKALEDWGMAMGPFRMMDMAGLDLDAAIQARRRAETSDRVFPSISGLAFARGWLGQKSGRGWYVYEAGSRKATQNHDLVDLITAWRGERGMVARQINADEIIDRCILALINEAAAILDEGIAQRPSDIDLVYLTGFGFPARRGGPLFHADTIGIRPILRRMQAFRRNGHGDANVWKAHPLLERLAAEQTNFNDYGRAK